MATKVATLPATSINFDALRERMRDQRGSAAVRVREAFSATKWTEEDEAYQYIHAREWMRHTDNIRKLDSIRKTLADLGKQYGMPEGM